ncbi:CHAT domain-containing protein [Aquipuribacter sp. MA13-6]|uniref:CHAT domain-containing protein n=1 Tax=unclassified Aquipuribacter TaxID=2635084 RepID=UPI003EEBA35F
MIDLSQGAVATTALQELKDCLPLAQEGESAAEMDWRVMRGKLARGREDEAKLAHRLGRSFIPAELRDELSRRANGSESRLKLVIAPAPELGWVPWSLFAVTVSNRVLVDSTRLVELADWVLAPSATVLAESSRRSVGPAPVALAILDTTNSSIFPALPAARSIHERLQPECVVIGGDHWAPGPRVSKTQLIDDISRLGSSKGLLFGCHATVGSANNPSGGALVLGEREDGSPIKLTALEVLKANGNDFPGQVSLLACDASDLAASSAGEWLSLAPAFLIRGAHTVVTTLFPLVDTSDQAVGSLITLLIEGRSGSEAVSQFQREQLNRWRNEVQPAALSEMPISWASLAVCATGRQAAEEDAHAAAPLAASSVRLNEAAERLADKLGHQEPGGAHFILAYVDKWAMPYSGSLWSDLGGAFRTELTERYLKARYSSVESTGGLAVAAQAAMRTARAEGSALEAEHLVTALLSLPQYQRMLSILGLHGNFRLEREVRANLTMRRKNRSSHLLQDGQREGSIRLAQRLHLEA